MDQSNAHSNAAKTATVPELCFYDDQWDHIIVIGRNTKLNNVRTTLQLSDADASTLYHMLGAALADMAVIRRLKHRAAYAS